MQNTICIISLKDSIKDFLRIYEYAWDPEYVGAQDWALLLNKPRVFIYTAGIMAFGMISFNIYKARSWD